MHLGTLNLWYKAASYKPKFIVPQMHFMIHPQDSLAFACATGQKAFCPVAYLVHCAVDSTASIAGGLISFDIDAFAYLHPALSPHMPCVTKGIRPALFPLSQQPVTPRAPAPRPSFAAREGEGRHEQAG